MSDDTSHKIDRKLSEAVKTAARERSGSDWGAVKRANHEMAFVWLALQPPDVQAETFEDDDVPFDSLEDVRQYLYGDLFSGDDDFAPYRLLNDFASDAIDDAVADAKAEARRTGVDLGEL